MHSHCHPLFCITPPYMLRAIAQRGSAAQQAQANRTLDVTQQLRVQRHSITFGEAEVEVPSIDGKQRRVYTADNGSNLPGRLVRQEGDPSSGDPAVDEAYEGSGATYDLFWETYQRNSIDGQGLRLDSTVHYQVGYDNAFWNGRQMVYGDGDEDLPLDQRLFNRFTIAVDIIGHELAHGVTQFSAKLNYAFQSGALNESMSDVFGVLVKQRILGHTAEQADWIIGGGLFTNNVNGVGIRSMKAPGTAYDDPLLGKDPQPAHMRDYVNTIEDNGGVHINSGIPNRAFYLTSMEIGGFAWEKAGQIWYKALKEKLTADSNLQDAANKTYIAAGELYGSGSLEQQAVRKGWADVGINVEAVTEAPGCLSVMLRMFSPSESRRK